MLRSASEKIAASTDFRVQGLRRLDQTRIDDLKGALAQSNPVLLSFRVDSAWQKHRGPGVFDHLEVQLKWGGHAMAIVGYDDRKQAFRVINSWGKGWGDGGYVWLSYDAYKTHVRETAILSVIPTRPPQPVKPPPPPRPQPNVVEIKPAPPAPAPVPPVPNPAPVVEVETSARSGTTRAEPGAGCGSETSSAGSGA